MFSLTSDKRKTFKSVPIISAGFNSARGLGSSAPVDTLLFLVKDDTLIAFTDQRDSSGVRCLCRMCNTDANVIF